MEQTDPAQLGFDPEGLESVLGAIDADIAAGRYDGVALRSAARSGGAPRTPWLRRPRERAAARFGRRLRHHVGREGFWVDPARDLTFSFLSVGLMEDSYHLERVSRLSDIVVSALVA